MAMVREVEPGGPRRRRRRSGKRALNRLARHRDYLQTALRIATEEGLDALTMQRLAGEVDAAIGTVYTYFPSKGALLAEVQREAIDRLLGSYLLLRPDVEARVADADPTWPPPPTWWPSPASGSPASTRSRRSSSCSSS